MSVRSFVALELKDESIKGKIRELQESLLRTGAQIKGVEPQNIHLTLKFLGETPEGSIPEIVEALSSIEMPKFSLHFNGIGAFPSMYRMNVIWIGVSEGAEQVGNLHRQIEERLAKYGRPEDFHAHLTVVRVKGGRNLSALAEAIDSLHDADFGTIDFLEFQFKKSILTPSGPVYTDIATFRLK